MSRSGDADREAPVRDAFGELEGAVARMLDEVHDLRRRTRAAEARIQDVEELLRRFTKGAEDPARLRDRAKRLGQENSELKSRIREARAGVERLQARIRFLEEQR